MKKEIVLFGTKHYPAGQAPIGIPDVINFILDKERPDIVLEEWSDIGPASFASTVAGDRIIYWLDIGTPNKPEFATHDHTWALDFTAGSAKIRAYGPIDVQERREKVMCKNISDAMKSYQKALIVLGLAHLHSMFMKLEEEFEVSAYMFTDELF
jgi:hypothetical protein